MKKIIGREREMEMLRHCLASDGAELVAVYGRRRVGKTYLIRHAFADDFFFYFTGAIGSTKKEQLDRFAKALVAQTGAAAEDLGSWPQAFEQLAAQIEWAQSKPKKIIFIDELPWLDSQKSGFLHAFDFFWNSFASSRKDVLLIVCGSATSWITRKLFRNRGGLRSRVTARIPVRPFTLAECEAFLKAKNVPLSRYDIVEAYMIFGGIPYYLDYFEGNCSLAGNVDNILFAEDAPLKGEFRELYASLFKNPEIHSRLVATLSKSMKGLTREELIEASGAKNGGSLTRVLEDLELSGFIRKRHAFPNKVTGALYQLTDSFSLFYFSVMEKVRQADVHYWAKSQNAPCLAAWRGCAFELACLRHVEQIRFGLGIAGVLVEISSWKSRNAGPGAQVELVIDRRDNVINLCEIRFSRHEYVMDKETEDNLRGKLAAFAEETKTRKALHLTMVTTYGVKRNPHSGIVQAQVAMDALFA
ncbi:MAG: ATP-binding protein [Clostridiales Family XIII bacterium]|jgi:hypothetical protein|nr:ATP-binding protein [Clostridiales Family XIII bacterium]